MSSFVWFTNKNCLILTDLAKKSPVFFPLQFAQEMSNLVWFTNKNGLILSDLTKSSPVFIGFNDKLSNIFQFSMKKLFNIVRFSKNRLVLSSLLIKRFNFVKFTIKEQTQNQYLQQCINHFITLIVADWSVWCSSRIWCESAYDRTHLCSRDETCWIGYQTHPEGQ